MTLKQVEKLLSDLSSTAMRGSKQAATGYSELSILVAAWRKKPTEDNWNDVVNKAQGVVMWVEPEQLEDREERPEKK
jgi:hypothetical protein